MKIFNKTLLIFLTGGFLSLNGMEEGDTLHESEAKEKKAQIDQTKKPLSLKAHSAIKILKLISSGILTWKQIAALPEELARYVVLFRNGDLYFNDTNMEPESELAKLILETKELLYKLIDTQSPHLDTFILALDEFFFKGGFEDSKKKLWLLTAKRTI